MSQFIFKFSAGFTRLMHKTLKIYCNVNFSATEVRCVNSFVILCCYRFLRQTYSDDSLINCSKRKYVHGIQKKNPIKISYQFIIFIICCFQLYIQTRKQEKINKIKISHKSENQNLVTRKELVFCKTHT